MKKFTLFWLTGRTEIVEGITINDAFKRKGFGYTAIRVLQFFEEGDTQSDYIWIEENRQWELNIAYIDKILNKY